MKVVVVIGSSNTDMVVSTDKAPLPGETVLGSGFFMAPGGKGANQAVAAARSGAKVIFVTRLGRDVFGKTALANFERDGIDAAYVFIDKSEPSGTALITVDKKAQNSIVVAPGANRKLSPSDIKRAEAAIKNAACVVLQQEMPEETVEFAVSLAHAYKVPVILNPAPARKINKAVLKKVYLLNPNETEAFFLSGIKIAGKSSAKAAAAKLLRFGPENVIITLGSKGVFAAGKGFEMFVPAFKVKAVDTTAAGDTFTGGFAAALAAGKDFYDSVRFGSAAAALCVTKKGAQSSIPFLAETVRFLGSR